MDFDSTFGEGPRDRGRLGPKGPCTYMIWAGDAVKDSGAILKGWTWDSLEECFNMVPLESVLRIHVLWGL